MDNERQWRWVKSLDELCEVVGVGLGCVRKGPWPIGQAESNMVGGDASVCGRERSNQVTPLERPRRGAMDEEERLALSLVDIVHAADAEVHPLARKWIG